MPSESWLGILSALVSASRQVGGRHAIAKSAPIPELTAKIESLLR